MPPWTVRSGQAGTGEVGLQSDEPGLRFFRFEPRQQRCGVARSAKKLGANLWRTALALVFDKNSVKCLTFVLGFCIVETSNHRKILVYLP